MSVSFRTRLPELLLNVLSQEAGGERILDWTAIQTQDADSS